MIRKNNCTVRVVQGFRGLNALPKCQNGGLDELLTIFDEKGELTRFTCLDLHRGFCRSNFMRGIMN